MREKATAHPEQSRDKTRDETRREFEATGPAPEGNPTGAQLQTALNEYMQMLNRMHLGFDVPPMVLIPWCSAMSILWSAGRS